MAQDFNVKVLFEPVGHAELKAAMDQLAGSQRTLTTTQSQYNKVARTTNAQGALQVKNNRLLTNTFATLRSKILLASFAAGLFGTTIGRLIRLAGEQELAEKRLEAALGRRSQTLLDQASALQQVTGFGDEAILSAQSLLAAFIKDEEQLKLATQATLDLAAAKGMDLTAAADLVGKTVGSSTNALSRYGIEVQGSAGSTQRLETAVRNISILFGGQAVAQTQTIAGQIKIFENNAGDLAEKIGKDLAESFMPLLKNFNEFIVEVQNGEASILGLKIGVEELADAIRIAAVAASFAFNPFKKLQTASTVVRAAVTTGRIALANYVGGLVGLGEASEDAEDNLKDLTKAVEEQQEAYRPLVLMTPEMIKQEEKLRSVRQKLTDAQLKLNFQYNQDKDILNEAIKVRDAFNKEFGTNIQLNREFLESLDPQALAIKTISDEQLNYLKILLQVFDATVALNEEQKKLTQTKEQIAAIGQLGQALQVFAGQNKQLTILAIRLQQIAAVADAYASFNKYLAEKRPLLAAAALATGLANAAQIEQQLGKARAAATGADFITQGRQMLMVGDNPTGRERVQVTPLGNGGGTDARSGSVTINLNGNILGTDEFVRDTLIPQIENAMGRNLA